MTSNNLWVHGEYETHVPTFLIHAVEVLTPYLLYMGGALPAGQSKGGDDHHQTRVCELPCTGNLDKSRLAILIMHPVRSIRTQHAGVVLEPVLFKQAERVLRELPCRGSIAARSF